MLFFWWPYNSFVDSSALAGSFTIPRSIRASIRSITSGRLLSEWWRSTLIRWSMWWDPSTRQMCGDADVSKAFMSSSLYSCRTCSRLWWVRFCWAHTCPPPVCGSPSLCWSLRSLTAVTTCPCCPRPSSTTTTISSKSRLWYQEQGRSVWVCRCLLGVGIFRHDPIRFCESRSESTFSPVNSSAVQIHRNQNCSFYAFSL